MTYGKQEEKKVREEIIYVYCITSKTPDLEEGKNLVDKLYFIDHQGIYAVTGKVKESEFDEEQLKKNLANLDWIKSKASIHEKIIEGVMKHTGVIPFKLGTIFNTEDSLKAMLEEHMQEFKTNLKNLDGKEEWGLKIYCDLEKLKEAIIKEDTEVLKIEEDINSSSPGKAYLLKKKKDEVINNVTNKRLNEYSQLSFDILKGFSLDARINKLLPREVTERKDDMVLNSAFLVDKSNVAKFTRTVDRFKAMYKDKGLDFDYTGPWPPYNFCSISERRE